MSVSFNPDGLFAVMNDNDAQNEAELMLQDFEIDNESFSCPDAITLHFILYVKRLVKLFPHIKEKLKDQVSSSQIINRDSPYESHYALCND